MGIVRVLFLADTHLGFDMSFRPRVERRRRGPEFFANFERTSFAEKNESKGYLVLEFELGVSKGSFLRQWQFHKLPVRPMVQLNLHPSNMNNAELRSWIDTRLSVLPEDSIVKIKIHGSVSQQAMEVLSAAALRALAPTSMNIN